MIKIRKSTDRGHVNHGWLDANHTFSFASYIDREHVGFQALRVINEDRIAPARGFGTHPHSDMEIVTYVLSGELEHKDSMGNGSVLKAGEFQVMSAGSGVTHSEFNPSPDNETHLYQIWLHPEEEGIAPYYDQTAFPRDGEDRKMQVIAAPRKGADDTWLPIHQDAKLYRSHLKAGEEVTLPLSAGRYGWMQVVSGNVTLADEHQLLTSDGASIGDLDSPRVVANEDSEFLLFDLAEYS